MFLNNHRTFEKLLPNALKENQGFLNGPIYNFLKPITELSNALYELRSTFMVAIRIGQLHEPELRRKLLARRRRLHSRHDHARLQQGRRRHYIPIRKEGTGKSPNFLRSTCLTCVNCHSECLSHSNTKLAPNCSRWKVSPSLTFFRYSHQTLTGLSTTSFTQSSAMTLKSHPT